MGQSWHERKQLLRLTGALDELLASSRAVPAAYDSEGAERQLAPLFDEIQTLLAVSDAAVAAEFARIVGGGPDVDAPAGVRAATAVGWLKAYVGTEPVDERRSAESQSGATARLRRRQTIGFRIRSPITRDAGVDDGGGTPS